MLLEMNETSDTEIELVPDDVT